MMKIFFSILLFCSFHLFVYSQEKQIPLEVRKLLQKVLITKDRQSPSLSKTNIDEIEDYSIDYRSSTDYIIRSKEGEKKGFFVLSVPKME